MFHGGEMGSQRLMTRPAGWKLRSWPAERPDRRISASRIWILGPTEDSINTFSRKIFPRS